MEPGGAAGDHRDGDTGTGGQVPENAADPLNTVGDESSASLAGDGLTMSTAMATLSLEVYYRYLPMYHAIPAARPTTQPTTKPAP